MEEKIEPFPWLFVVAVYVYFIRNSLEYDTISVIFKASRAFELWIVKNFWSKLLWAFLLFSGIFSFN